MRSKLFGYCCLASVLVLCLQSISAVSEQPTQSLDEARQRYYQVLTSRLDAVQSELDEVRLELAELQARASEPIELPPIEPEPPIVQQPAKWLVTIDGKRVDGDEFIAKHYKRAWTYPGTIHAHLAEHGVTSAEIAGVPREKLERLHSAIHETEQKPAQKPVQQVRTVVTNPCPGGVCPSPSRPFQTRQPVGVLRRLLR